MATTKADKTYTINGMSVKEKLTTWTSTKFTKINWVVIHNTNEVTHSNTSMAAQYALAQYNHNLNDVAVHYYVDNKEIWHCLPDTVHGWHAADGTAANGGNMTGIAIEVIENTTNSTTEDRAAKLAAYLLKQNNLDISHLKTHHDFYSKKYCPNVILPHWSTFKKQVETYLKALSSTTTSKTIYRVRKSWSDASSQIGAYSSLDNAKKACKAGYSVYDAKGNEVYTVENSTMYYVRKTFKDKKTQLGAFSVLKNATYFCNQYPGYYVFDKSGKQVSASTAILGDVDNDGKIAAADARLALNAATGKTKLDDGQKARADMDQDGKITASDARTILNKATGK